MEDLYSSGESSKASIIRVYGLSILVGRPFDDGRAKESIARTHTPSGKGHFSRQLRFAICERALGYF
jgi:hypothetical protein